MKMYIANGTHQSIDFQYRLPEYKNYRQQTIPIGGQIKISGDLSPQQIDLIIQFHVKYGMVKYNEISDFKGFFIPYVYSIDEPLSSEVIAELIIQNRSFNKDLGEKLRAEAAIAVNSQIETNAKENVTTFQVEIQETVSKDRDPTISEKIVVTRDQNRGAPQGPTHRSPISLVSDFIKSKPKSKLSF